MSALVTARTWRIHWPRIAPTVKRYQEAVERERVLADHRAAIDAEPVDGAD